MPIIDEQFIKNLKKELTAKQAIQVSESTDVSEEAFKRIVRLVGVRDRSVEEMRKRLIQEEFDEAIIEDALERALGCGLLDDSRFAESLVRTRLSAGKGMRGIEAELEKNGIDPTDLTERSKEELPSREEEFERALVLLHQKPPRSKNKREGAYRKLVSKGFGSSIASDAARVWSSEL